MNNPLFCTVFSDAEERLEERRSIFICAVRQISSSEQAEQFIRERREKHPASRHSVFAYVLRDGTKRYADDGEPQGTAGMPTLEAIAHAGVVDVCAVTTRYFGGILLGTGGLTRAYGSVARNALQVAGVTAYFLFTDFDLSCTYADYQRIQRELPRFGGRERRVAYSDRVMLTVAVPASEAAAFGRQVSDITAGRCIFEQKDTYPDRESV